MEIHGYKVFDFKLIADGNGKMVDADRTCDCCLGSSPKLMRASLEGMWEDVSVCMPCMVKEGLFLSIEDLIEEVEGL